MIYIYLFIYLSICCRICAGETGAHVGKPFMVLDFLLQGFFGEFGVLDPRALNPKPRGVGVSLSQLLKL